MIRACAHRARGDAALVCEAIALRGLAKLWIDRLPVDGWMRAADDRIGGARHGTLDDLDRITDPVLRRWWPTRTTCLPRALARYVMARRRGLPVVFVMGVRESHDVLQAHAWLELDGVPILEREPTDYRVTWRHPEEPDR